MASRRVALALAFALSALASEAGAQEPEAPVPPAPAPAPEPVSPSPVVAPAPVAPAPPAPAPVPAAAPSAPRRFEIDPLADGALIGLSGSFAGVLEVVIGTGELKPQQPVGSDRLLGIDRGAVKEKFDSSASAWSNVGLFTAIGFAVLDPILTGVRDDWHAALNDAVLYAESLTVTMAATNLAKISVRRPRPTAYAQQEKLREQFGSNAPDITSTDSSLSFFSGHSAITASVGATATYLAFARSPRTVRPWVTLGLGAAVTAFVARERVEAGAHFPTDVIAGAIAGAAVGVIVPHIHRTKDARALHVGVAPRPEGGAEIRFGGLLF